MRTKAQLPIVFRKKVRAPAKASQDIRAGRMTLASDKFIGFRQRFSKPKKKWNDGAAQQQRNSPAPLLHFFRREPRIERYTKGGGKHHRNLLAAGLPTHVKALVAGSGDFRQIDGNATKFHAGRETL